jgi:predicted dehydrogenase
MAVAAATAGCHIICEKPLAVNATEARRMLQAVEQAGVKHGYAATGGYDPVYIHTRALLAAGLIGPVRLIEYHLMLPMLTGLLPYLPYSWNHQVSQGGGFLNNIFTHQLQQILVLTSGTVSAAAGSTWGHLHTAPVGPVIHDFRHYFGAALTAEQAARSEQRAFDADFNATIILQLRMPGDYLTNVLVQLAVVVTHPPVNTLTIFGDRGTLYLSGPFWPDATIEHFDPQQGERVPIPIPQAVIDSLPSIEDATQRQWNQFFYEFVADIRGAGATTYPTFRDGWVAAEVIEIIRRGGLTTLASNWVTG